MAAVYSGIHLKLKSPRTPWPDKLKLARFAWISPQCFLPNKEQVLFDWTSHALTGYYSKKVEFPQEVLEGLWTYLDDILRSKKLQNALSHGRTLSLRLPMAQVINDRILEAASGTSSASISTVLSCCQGILSSSVLSVTYTTRYELLVELLARLCSLACSRLQLCGEHLRPQEFEVLLLVLGSYLVVQRQQANPNRVFAQVTTHLLQPLLLLRYLLGVRVWAAADDARVRQHLSRDIRGKVDAVLQSALFLPEHLPSYREELLPETDTSAPKRSATSKGLPSPVSSILKRLCDPALCDPSLHFAVRSHSVPMLFKCALDAFCKAGDNKMVCFRLLTRLVTALGFTEELTVTSTFDSANWSLALLALENLLNFSLTADIYNVAADRIQHGEAQFNLYRKVAQLLFYNPQSTVPAWYRCLKTLLALNHLIVEPDLDEMVSSAWVDADCAEVRVKKAREALLSAVLQTYTKLRQLPRLFQEVLSVICRPAADDLRLPLLTTGLQRSLTRSLLDSPPSQSVEICSLILERVQTYLLPDLEGKDDMALKLFSLSTLLHSILFGVKSLDNSTPAPVVRQMQSLMGKMLELIKLLLQLLGGKESGTLWFESVHKVALLLSYSWVEVDMLFRMHCSRYAEQSSSVTAAEGSCLLPGVVQDEWDQVFSVRPSPASQLLQQLLALQRTKQVLLGTHISPGANIQDVLCRDARFIVRAGKASFSQLSDELWDQQVTSVDATTYSAAHWFVLTSNLGLIAPYLAEEDMSHVAEVLLDSLLREDPPESAEQQGACLSVSLISKNLLESAILVELPPLYSVIVRCLCRRILGILSSTAQGSQCPALLKFGEELRAAGAEEKEASAMETSGETEGISPAWKRLESVAQEILSPSEATKLTGTQIESLTCLLKIARVVNPDAMSPEDHTECFLLLFFIGTNILPYSDTDPSEALGLLKEVYGLMTSLQSGRNVGSVLKVVHGSRLLEAAMSSLFTQSHRHLSVDPDAWLVFVKAFQDFIQCLIQVVIQRRKSVRLNLEKITSFAVGSGTCPDTQGPPGSEELASLQLRLACLSVLCQAMTSSLGQSKTLDETLIQLLAKVTEAMGPAVQLYLRGHTCGLHSQAFSVDVVRVMVQAELAWASSPTPDGGERKDLPHMGLYRSFTQQVLRELCSAPRPMDFLLSSLHFLSIYYAAAEMISEPHLGDLYVSAVQNLRTLLSAPWLSQSEVRELEAPVREVLAQLVVRSSLERFHLLLEAVREGLGVALVWSGRHKDVLSTLLLIKMLATCPLPETCSKAFWFMAPQIISAVVFVVKECSKEKPLTATLAVPALEALTSVLRQGEGLLTNPHHVTLAFGALQFIPLELPSMEEYHSAFQAVHETLFAIIQCHPQVMLKAAPSFLNCFYRLVVSVMHEGRQKGEGDSAESEVVLSCSRLVERMYTHIAATAESFTVLSSFMVAQYVSELQKVTLHPEIKRHLTEGIYKILDLCMEQDVKFLSATLPLGVREVFNELYSSYTHYHKAQKQGEEKYSA
ncbi:unhealthy ribosome biogenesis protein 2 homolog [Megalops cyprinoides]|uniref:unhealthy ribosome biogenesis protein 2 homolog n=1 Tax=Megalops cyprinoides TaxID=118141 RepID=UPI001864F386|nr:unhealthy ribosome biogenesis protein 2 homolog [Megalops cyprinoides]